MPVELIRQASAPRLYRPQARAILQVIFDGYGDTARDSQIQVIPIIPKAVTVHINSYKQADSFELVFEAGDLPIDPQLVRAGAAEIFIFQTSSTTERRRVLDRRHPLANADPGDTTVREPTDTLGLELGIESTRDAFTLGNKPRIVGTFDDDDMELSGSGKFITIKGQDYTHYLMTVPWPPHANGTARRIPVGKRLDLIVDELLEEADPDRQLAVQVRGIDPGLMPIVHAEVATNAKRGIPIENGTSYWDVIYKLVERYGFICFVDGLDVVISRPKTITDRDTSSIKRMAWGKNLEHLTLRRHLGKEQSPTIVVRSYDPKVGTISAEFPTGGVPRDGVFKFRGNKKPRFKRRVKETTTVSKRGKVRTTVRERDEYQIFTVHGVTDPKILAQIAENRYHLLGKAERTVIAKTHDLDDLKHADILGVEAGDAFTIEWDEFNRELLSNPAVSMSVKVAHLVSRGFNDQIAAEIAKRYEILRGIDRPLRFKEGTIEYTSDDGVSIEMELQDFMVMDGIREGTSDPPRQSMLSQRRASLTGADGKPIGWSQAKIDANRRRFAKP